MGRLVEKTSDESAPHVAKRYAEQFNKETFLRENPLLVHMLRAETSLRSAREVLWEWLTRLQFKYYSEDTRPKLHPLELVVARDCIHALRLMTSSRKEKYAEFSLVRALWDVAHGRKRPDLEPAFWAETIHLCRGVNGKSAIYEGLRKQKIELLEGREAAIERSKELDEMWAKAQRKIESYPHGLQPEIIHRRQENRKRILNVMGASADQWNDWHWQVQNVVKDPLQVERLVSLTDEERECIAIACKAGLPFGVTPYYLSLMDNDNTHDGDHAVRAQVFPDRNYVEQMTAHRGEREQSFDFMLERDTSPIDLITRRYPTIAIFKPYNTCPQICVYCQRNWEIEDVLDHRALADQDAINRALEWIRSHPAITEVLITGGDPLVLSDDRLAKLLEQLASIDHLQRIRVGSRTPVTLPMRITENLAGILSSFRKPGHRELALVTHVEHPYEVTPAMVEAIDRLRSHCISVYNQAVFTLENSRRFESALLRRLLRLAGIVPYYTFNMKGKEETETLRVPMARLLQEQKEEARLLSGLERTDEAVYNVPRLGKNYLKAAQHRDLISILPDGRRVYEFHPWEKQMMLQGIFVMPDVPILPYLEKLEARGEDPYAYESIWYYY
jgi:lysine 2,3-aminomutase